MVPAGRDVLNPWPFDIWKKMVVNEVRRCAAIGRRQELDRGVVDGPFCEKREADSTGCGLLCRCCINSC